MFHKSRVLRLALLSMCISTMGACSSNATNSTTTSIASTTTLEKNLQDELDSLAASLNAVDYSRISESDCGKFALIVEKNQVKFFEWKENSWFDTSTRLGKDYEIDPYLVTTADYTGDGITEFLVSYNKEGQQGGHEFGGIFLQIGCEWQWAKFKGFYEPEESMDLLTYDKSTKELTAWGDGPAGRADVILTFNSESLLFDAQTLSADDVDQGSNHGNSQTRPTRTVVGVRCKDGFSLSSGCYAIYSDGSTRGIDGQGPWTGGVVSSTDFIDALGNQICVLMYENGRGKSSYC